jgi:transcriptional regulator with XRE-family HTH domain
VQKVPREIGEKIKELRISAGYKTLGRLHRDSGVTVATLSRIESGVQIPSPETLRKLAPYLGVSVEYLMAAAGYLPEKSIPINPVPIHEKRFYNLAKELSSKEKEVIENLMQLLVEKGAKKRRTKIPKKVEEGAPMYDGNTFQNEEFKVADHKKSYIIADEPIDLRSTPMAAHIEGAESVPLTPELEETIKDGIREARRRKREKERKEKEKKDRKENGATTENE